MENFDIRFDLHIREIMRRARQGNVDSNDLTNTEKAHILQFAKEDQANAWMEINSLMKNNPETDFEYWEVNHDGYRIASDIIAWITKPIDKPIDEIKPPLKTIKKTSQKTTYQWQKTFIDYELKKLHKNMLGVLIDKNTTLDDFKAIFTAKPIESINPIKWHNDNASELLYFIEKCKIVKTKRSDYKKLTSCFLTSDGTKFKAEFKVIKQNLDINLSDKKQKSIDKILSNL